jgi:hypothetical protein
MPMPPIRLAAWENSDEYRKMAEKIYEQKRLEEMLRAGGDPRLGGSLPLGGKSYAWGTKGPTKTGLFEGMNPAAAQGHDAYMNIIESILEDLRRPK